MPTFDGRKYPDDLDGILKDPKLERIFKAFRFSAKDTATTCVDFAIQPPKIIDADALSLLCEHGKDGGVSEQQLKVLEKMRKEKADRKRINAWPDLPEVLETAKQGWKKKHGPACVAEFYKSKVFERRGKYEKGFNQAGDLFAAMDITITSAILKKMGYAKTTDKKLQAGVRDLARAELTKRRVEAKKKFKEINKIEAPYASYEAMVKALKKHRVI